MHRFLSLATLMALSAPVFAADPAPTTPATTTPAATAPATATATGAVKSIDATKQTLVVTIDGKDTTFETKGLTLGIDIKAGTTVDVSYTDTKASAVVVHKP